MHNLEKNIMYFTLFLAALQSSFINLNTGIVISPEPEHFRGLNISMFIVVSYMFINDID